MVAAIESVMSGQLSIRKAAAEFNVPKSSLGDRIHGRVQHGKKNGPDTPLTPADEANLSHKINNRNLLHVAVGDHDGQRLDRCFKNRT